MSVRELLELPGFKAFMAEIEDMRDGYRMSLEGSYNPIDMHRAQGAIEAITRIIDLPERMEVESGLDEEDAKGRTRIT